MSSNFIPYSMMPIKELIGEESVHSIIGYMGGEELYICKNFIRNQKLIEVIGQENTQKMIDEFGGQKFKIPKNKASIRERVIKMLEKDKYTAKEIAYFLDTSEAYIYQIKKELGL